MNVFIRSISTRDIILRIDKEKKLSIDKGKRVKKKWRGRCLDVINSPGKMSRLSEVPVRLVTRLNNAERKSRNLLRGLKKKT